ncbi:HAD family hydrolase [uncultured Dokdonia sp.]|uniref:NIF family HAD-type phosphatase n=1 Tax=uncultured Dokdonia sp. TaxID=575653 RepID=UPI00260F37CF|nr:HAD family hydrolase [uncultured Dokdonia sp.]
MVSENKKNILLILDLDETLIHATEVQQDIPHCFTYADYYIYKRPYLEEFLKMVSVYFDLAIWSSADDRYVEDIVAQIKPPTIDFKFIWGRSRCTTRRDYSLDTYIHEKRLKKVKKQGYTIERMLIVDDSPEKTKDNYGNAIYINPFEGNQEDHELQLLLKYLSSIKELENIRNLEKRGWRNQV